MTWERCGLLFQPDQQYAWLHSHAAIPVVDYLGDNHYRVYFSGRDVKGRAQIGYLEFNIANPQEILRISPEPSIGLGPLGAYDDNGVTSSCLVNADGRKYQYYTGWSIGVTVPFYFYIGLAISEDNGKTFTKVSPAPILERDAIDPYLTASPCVLVEHSVWRMWYVSCVKWTMENNAPKHYYHIKYAESLDGIHWKREGKVCIDFASADESAIARPFVINDNGLYKMWFSYRGAAYHIGYAESQDGLNWVRKEQAAGLTPSTTGWDSEMVEYGCIFDHAGQRYMLYNGNRYGATGFGLAAMR